MKSKKLNEALKEAFEEGLPVKGVSKSIPRDNNIVSFVIKYDDGTEKEIEKGMLIYADNSEATEENQRGIGLEQNGGIGFNIQAFMCHTISIYEAGFKPSKIMNDALTLIKKE